MPDDVEITLNQAGWLAVERETLRQRGPKAESAARRFAPVRTGRLKSSIDVRYGEDGTGPYFDLTATARNPRDGFPYPYVVEARESFLRAAVGLVAAGSGRVNRRARQALKATRAARRARRQAKRGGA